MTRKLLIHTTKYLTITRFGIWGIGILMLVMLSGLSGQNTSPENDTVGSNNQIDKENKKKSIIKKNIFKPALFTAPPVQPNPETTSPPDPGPMPLNRPFKVIAFDQTDDGRHAYLQFDNPSDLRAVKVGDIIETIRILEINPPFIRCQYDQYEVRIDAGESSNEALAHIRGFGRDYELVGTTVLDEMAFAHILIQNRLRRVEIGDKLGDAIIIDIQPGKFKLRYDDGFEIEIPAKP